MKSASLEFLFHQIDWVWFILKTTIKFELIIESIRLHLVYMVFGNFNKSLHHLQFRTIQNKLILLVLNKLSSIIYAFWSMIATPKIVSSFFFITLYLLFMDLVPSLPPYWSSSFSFWVTKFDIVYSIALILPIHKLYYYLCF